MSIKTHYALKRANETDNAQMNSRTSRAVATKLYFACDEGAGTTITDYGPEGVVLDNADASTTVAYSTANMMDTIHADAAPNTGDIRNITPGANSFLAFVHGVPQTLDIMFKFVIGETSVNKHRITFVDGTDAVVISAGTDSSGNKFTTGGVTLTEDCFWAVFCDRTSNTVYFYESLNAATVALSSSQDCTSLGTITFAANKMTMGNAASQKFYGAGLYVFENDVPTPATVLTNLETIRQNTKSSDKSLPVDWISYT